MTTVPGRWIEAADEPCGFCLQHYELALELRCSDCDRPLCPVCAVTVRARGEALCAECGPAAVG